MLTRASIFLWETAVPAKQNRSDKNSSRHTVSVNGTNTVDEWIKYGLICRQVYSIKHIQGSDNGGV